jgi:phospholipase C
MVKDDASSPAAHTRARCASVVTLLPAALTALLLAACSSTITTNAPAPAPTHSSAPSATIQHVIIVFQENRSFNNLFMKFPGADTSTTGPCVPYTPPGFKEICSDPDPQKRVVRMRPITLETCSCLGGTDIAHSHQTLETEYDGGKMDGFDKITFGTKGSLGPAKFYPYAYVERSEVQPYWDMASRYGLADHMFSTATTDSFVAHQEIIAGTTRLNGSMSLTDTPSSIPWGCDAAAGTVTGVIYTSGRVNDFGGPFPCFTQYKTMADVLDAGAVSWKYYVESYDLNSPYVDFGGRVWDAFDAIKSVRYGPDWKNVTIPNTKIFADIKDGKLPQVSWVMPTLAASDHPASGNNLGPSWVTSIVNAVGKSPYWKNTAVLIMWDDWGGFYDNVPPPQLDYTSLGMRVPLIVVSPYAKPHFISTTQYEFGSVLKFIEQTFGTNSLGSTDVRANSIVDMFDFSQSPSTFKPFSARYSQQYLINHQPLEDSNALIERNGGPPD